MCNVVRLRMLAAFSVTRLKRILLLFTLPKWAIFGLFKHQHNFYKKLKN